VKSPPFEYRRPASVDEAVGLLAEFGDAAKVLAGGQSLLPIMALRLGRPEYVLDIGRVEGLDAISLTDERVSVGALVTHRQAELSHELEEAAPLVHAAMPFIGHRAIRSRGTVCGSIAHADPAAEMPAVCLATNATMHLVSQRGTRDVAAVDFFKGYLETAIEPDELLTAVSFPRQPDNTGVALVEESRRHRDFALVGVACTVTMDIERSVVDDARLAFFGVAATPVRATTAEAALHGQPPTDFTLAAAAALACEWLSPSADIHASANYRTHLAGVLTHRALSMAASSRFDGAAT
jgi:aerobic carbon-monoxide dehydrogenase medium subunit